MSLLGVGILWYALRLYHPIDPKVGTCLKQEKPWREETALLRQLAFDCGLTEELKWGKPCYTCEGGNVAIIHPFKAYCALMFFKGSLLKDPKGIPRKPGANSQDAHQARFTNAGDIIAQKATLKAYLQEAIALEKAGLKVAFKQSPEPTPAELAAMLDRTPRPEKGLRRAHSRPPAQLHHPHLQRQAIRHPRHARRKMRPRHSRRPRLQRALALAPQAPPRTHGPSCSGILAHPWPKIGCTSPRCR